MEKATPLVISISRQKGCGGAYLGQMLAKSLGMAYLDRQLVAEIAHKLGASIAFVEAHDERIPSNWESVLESLCLSSNPWLYNPPAIHTPAYRVSQMETEAIVKAASEQAVIVVGRGASHLLRAHPKHVAVFLHASKELRVQRTQQIYGMSRKEAVCSIDKADIERARYNKSLSGFDMCDATQYHLCLDTGVIGIDKAEELIIQYVHARFPDTAS